MSKVVRCYSLTGAPTRHDHKVANPDHHIEGRVTDEVTLWWTKHVEKVTWKCRDCGARGVDTERDF